MADAGTPATKTTCFTSDADFRSYNGNVGPPDPESDWSCGAWDAADEVCTGTGHELSNLDSDADLDARVWIQCLEHSATASELDDPTHAPELAPSGETNYFYNIRQWSWRECYGDNCR
jgi:hypothetical protein